MISHEQILRCASCVSRKCQQRGPLIADLGQIVKLQKQFDNGDSEPRLDV